MVRNFKKLKWIPKNINLILNFEKWKIITFLIQQKNKNKNTVINFK